MGLYKKYQALIEVLQGHVYDFSEDDPICEDLRLAVEAIESLISMNEYLNTLNNKLNDELKETTSLVNSLRGNW